MSPQFVRTTHGCGAAEATTCLLPHAGSKQQLRCHRAAAALRGNCGCRSCCMRDRFEQAMILLHVCAWQQRTVQSIDGATEQREQAERGIQHAVLFDTRHCANHCCCCCCCPSAGCAYRRLKASFSSDTCTTCLMRAFVRTAPGCVSGWHPVGKGGREGVSVKVMYSCARCTRRRHQTRMHVLPSHESLPPSPLFTRTCR